MKVSTKISVLAGISTLALVGTAFAAWQFNKDVSIEKTSNVAVSKKTVDGSLALNHETFYLTLDQAGISFTLSSYESSEADINDAITSLELTYTGSTSSNDASDITITGNYSVDEALAEYVEFTGGSMGDTSASANIATATYTLPTASFKAGKKPTTEAQYDSMKTALASAKITFNFSAAN